MSMKAVISNKAHPEYGQATIPFPIPDSEYDRTIGLLEDMEIGSPTAQDCQVDGRMAALDLLQNHSGTITPYGVVYDNGMKLEPLYDGRHFPSYLYKPSLMVLEVDPDPAGTATGYLYLPGPARQLQRTLLRAGHGPEGFRLKVIMDELPTEVSSLVSPTRDSLDALNALCQAVEPMNSKDRRKLEAVVLMTHPQCAGEVRQMAENLDQFDFVPKPDSPMADSALTELGYVAYHGSLTLDELMADDPAELYQREQEMGGMAQ